MNQFRKVLKEMSVVLRNIALFDEFLNVIIIFLACYLVLIIFKFYPILAAIPAFIYASISIVLRMRKIKQHKADIVESSYSPLREKLRTAIDNIKMNNPIVEALQKEVVEAARNMGISSFIRGTLISYKTLTAIILCFVILFVAASSFGIDIRDVINRGKDLISAVYVIGGDELGEELGEIMAATGGTQLNDIYGKESAANVGNEVIEVEIRPISYEINVRNVKDIEETEFEESILDETCADTDECVPQESYRNDYPKDQQELVKNYFLKISR